MTTINLIQKDLAMQRWEFIKENKKTRTRPRKRSRKQERKQELDQEKKEKLSFYWIIFLVEFLFSCFLL